MKQKTEKAVSGFRSGLNCAQAVLTAFSDDYKVDNGILLSLSCGFGAGMGRLQETCGAVTGSFMVFGLHSCMKFTDNKQRKEDSYLMIREFDKKFRNIYGTLKCKELLKVDLQTPEGQKSFHDDNLSMLVCEKCIADSISIVHGILAKEPV